jgi:hypothetical protein
MVVNSVLRRVAFWLGAVAVLTFVSGCAASPRWTLSIDRVGPTYVPALEVNGTVQRVAALTISGPPEQVTPLLKSAQAEGWKARLLDNSVEIDPVGHSLDEVTALSFRINNGEFGDLKLNVLLRPDKTVTARAEKSVIIGADRKATTRAQTD